MLFAQIPIVVIPILLFSLIESKFVLPAHLKHIKLRTEKGEPGLLSKLQQRFADGFEQAILKYYQPLLGIALRHRLVTLVSFIGVLMVIIALVTSGWSRFTFFPRIQSELARATLLMPTGTHFEITDRYVQQITDAAFALKERYREEEGAELILNIQSTSGSNGGSSGSHRGRVMFEIVPPEDRESQVTSVQLIREWRQMIGTIPGAESLTFRAEIGRSSDPIDIQFSGNDFRTLTEVGNKLKQQLALYPSVFDISDSHSDGKEELQLELKPEAHALGLTRAEILGQIRNAFYGFQAQRFQRGRDDIRVMVRFPQDERQSVASLHDLRIKTPDGASVPLQQLVTLTPGKSPTAIIRINNLRTIKVSADINKQTANMLVIEAELRQFLDNLLAQYPGIQYQFKGEAQEQSESFGSMGIGLMIVLFVIYALLAIPFKSYLQPLIVMSVIPFGAIGAIAGHWIMGMDLTMLSMLGMMALVGVVVNDSLVLVDFINNHKHEYGGRGKEGLMQAVLNAGAARFRPVMLTSLTTFIGLMPLLFEQSTQAQFLIPMAISLGFGILFATLITLILVPVNYLLVEEAKQSYLRFINGGRLASAG